MILLEILASIFLWSDHSYWGTFFVIDGSPIQICNFSFIRNTGFKNTSEEYFSPLIRMGYTELIFQNVNIYNMKRSASCSNRLENPQGKQTEFMFTGLFRGFIWLIDFELPGGGYRMQHFSNLLVYRPFFLEDFLLIY